MSQEIDENVERMFELYFNSDADEELFETLETQHYLANSVEKLGGIETLARILEKYATRAAIRRRDWRRFIHFSLLALNLRRFPESLLEPEILQALCIKNNRGLVNDLIQQISDPYSRFWAFTTMVRTTSRHNRYDKKLIDHLQDSFFNLEPTTDSTQADWLFRGFQIYKSIERLMEEKHVAHWLTLFAHDESRKNIIRVEAAASFLKQDERLTEISYGYLEKAILGLDEARFLAPGILGFEKEPFIELLELLGSTAKPEFAWLLALTWIAIKTSESKSPVVWDHCLTHLPLPEDAAWLETCEQDLAHLDDEQRLSLYRKLTDARQKAMLATLMQSINPDPHNLERAFRDIQALEPDEAAVPCYLKLLRTYDFVNDRQGARIFRALSNWLYEIRYAMEPKLLNDYLRLFQAYNPKKLLREFDNMLWSPSTGASVLRYLAEHTTSDQLRTRIFEKAERFALTVCDSEAEAFELRCELFHRTVPKLCLKQDGLEPLNQAVERLLPEEEDDLYAVTFETFIEVNRPDLAEKVVARISNPRLVLTARLRIEKSMASIRGQDQAHRGPLDIPYIYRSVTNNDRFAWETRILEDMARSPEQTDSRVADHALTIKDKNVHARAMIHLACHGLVHQKATYRKSLQDLQGAIRFMRPSVLAASSGLLPLIPEIIAIGTQMDGNRAYHEYREGFIRLFSSEEGTAEQRCHIFQKLLAMLRQEAKLVIEKKSSLDKSQMIRIFECLVDLPELKTAAMHVRNNWHLLLGPLMATLHMLPTDLGKRPLQLAKKRSKKWHWLPKNTSAVVGRWFDSNRHGSGLQESTFQHIKDDTEVYLYRQLAEGADRILDTLAKMPPGKAKDQWCIPLVRYGWLDDEPSQKVLNWIQDPDWKNLLCVEGAFPMADLAWVDKLIATVKDGFDPFETEHWPQIRRLWQLQDDPRTQEQSLHRLAQAVLANLEENGTQRAERMLLLWLNLYLAPKLGTVKDTQDAYRAIEAAIRKAGNLVPADEHAASPNEDPIQENL